MDATRFQICPKQDIENTRAWNMGPNDVFLKRQQQQQQQVSCIFKKHQKAWVVSGSGEINTVHFPIWELLEKIDTTEEMVFKSWTWMASILRWANFGKLPNLFC